MNTKCLCLQYLIGHCLLQSLRIFQDRSQMVILKWARNETTINEYPKTQERFKLCGNKIPLEVQMYLHVDEVMVWYGRYGLFYRQYQRAYFGYETALEDVLIYIQEILVWTHNVYLSQNITSAQNTNWWYLFYHYFSDKHNINLMKFTLVASHY